MKRLFIYFILTVMMTVSAAAAHIPDNEVCENRDGRQLIVKTYTLSPDDDPDPLIEEPFEREGYSYSFVSIVKDEKPFERMKAHSETVTVETTSQDLAVILDALDATIPYDDGEYSGVLALDHTSLKTEATGYSSKSYTVSTTKTIEGLDRNDPGYVPKTTVKDGVTLTLQNIEWSVQGSALSGDALVPTQYMAIATYSSGASRKVADGYITTAAYTGEITSSGIGSVVYTVAYYGEPIKLPPESEKLPIVKYLIYIGLTFIIVAAAVAAYLLLRKNTKVYTSNRNGDEYELIGKLWLSSRAPHIDLLSFKEYPYSEAIIEIKSRAARRLFGKSIRIRTRDGVVKHRIEQNGNENYWFTVSTLIQEENA